MIDGLDDVFREPNGPAYETREERVGPPLSYVQEKIATSLTRLHRLAMSMAALPSEQRATAAGESGRAVGPMYDHLLGLAREAFYFELVAFLALSNMLALTHDGRLVDRLLAYDAAEFRDWINRIEEGGSVTG